jgi:DNA polymerase-3 subunit gamma/tau
MFATTEPQRIPDTILSRVQRFDFKRIPPDVVIARLGHIAAAEGVEIEEDALRLIARAGEGSMRDSQSLMDQVISFAGDKPTLAQVSDILGLVDRAFLYQMLEGILVADADACLAAIESVYGYGFELAEFTSEMLTLIRNATLVGLSPKSKEYLDVPTDERVRLESLVERSHTDVLVRAFHVMLDVHDQVARSNRPRLVLEMAVARLVSIRPAQPIDRLLHRLDDLEQRIREAGGVALPPPRKGATPRASADDKESSL